MTPTQDEAVRDEAVKDEAAGDEAAGMTRTVTRIDLMVARA
jgi:hypothetical protein